MKPLSKFSQQFQNVIFASTVLVYATSSYGIEYISDIQPILKEYCIKCHGGEKIKGDIDFTQISTSEDAASHFEIWETVADVLAYDEMPPEEEETRPGVEETELIINWYEERFVRSVTARPAVFKPRILSAPEYRNTLRSVFGFDLEVTFIAAEQTTMERSLALKLLPTDPPGASGYINDTHAVRLTSTTLEQYTYLADRALLELFSNDRLDDLSALIGQPLPPGFQVSDLNQAQATSLLRTIATRTYRRPVPKRTLNKIIASIKGKQGQELVEVIRSEIKALLVSPQFLYRGLLLNGKAGKQQRVDNYELAERLSYFLWEDMPDGELLESARRGRLKKAKELAVQIDRMLASPKARNLAESFGYQWLDLADIDLADSDVTARDALRSQPLDFLDYLFTENRPVMELIDSKVAFTNYITARFYPKDNSQLVKYVKPKGIEKQLGPNQRILLEHADERGGILTIPGRLAMNRGPILRGTWMLRRILGDRLGDPPADVPAIQATLPDESLSFRDRFEKHRSDPTCARCHDRIDPLGFALQGFDESGAFKLASNYKAPRRKSEYDASTDSLDTSGQMPSGEAFEDFAGLKQILLGPKRPDVIRNAVEQVMAYALARKLEAFDRPAIDTITEKIDETDGSWRDLFVDVALSLPFQETIVSPDSRNDS